MIEDRVITSEANSDLRSSAFFVPFVILMADFHSFQGVATPLEGSSINRPIDGRLRTDLAMR